MFAEIVTVQFSTPTHPPPFQPAKVEPAAAVAVSVICVPETKLAEHVPPQLIPEGLLVTVPEPLPAGATDSMKLCGIAEKIAATVGLPAKVYVQGAVPLHTVPPHPEKVEPGAALAVRVTCWPLVKSAEH